MPRRGTILRDTSAGPGLLVVDGTQYPFDLAGIWRSDVPPRTGMVVDVELDAAGKVTLVTAVPEESALGLQAGDVILQIGDRTVEDPTRVRSILATYDDDELVTFRIRRDGRDMDVSGRMGTPGGN